VRRFFLLPEEEAAPVGQRPRIRRYRLASVGARGRPAAKAAAAFVRGPQLPHGI
jgi:hypothetical protein